MRIHHIVILMFGWLMGVIQAFASVHFIDNGFEYSSLDPRQCGQYSVKDTTDVVMLKGYVSTYSFAHNQSLHIPSSVVYGGKTYKVIEIGEYALAYLQHVESIIFEEGIERVNAYAICYCINLKYVYFPASVNNIHNSLFICCPNLTELVIDSENGCYDSRDHCNAIIHDEELVIGCNGTKIPASVTSIGEGAFYGRNGLEEIIIPEGVTSIGFYAFADCGSLRHVSLPFSLEEINPSTFENCTSLESIYIPKNVSKITDNIFAGCTRLSSIVVDRENATYHSNCNGIVEKTDSTLIATCIATTITPDIKRFNSGCFCGVNIHTFRLPNNIIDFSANYFYNCNEIDTLSVDSNNPYYMSPEGSNVILTRNGKNMMMGCRTSIIPEKIDTIGSDAFRGRYSNSLLKLPNGLKVIECGAFRDCTRIRNAIIPSSVSYIGESAFENCCNLVGINISEGVKSIGQYAFENCEQLSVVHLPSSIETIGYSAFHNCRKLMEINIPEGIKEIELLTFKDCISLKHVNLPSSIENVQSSAFENCRNLVKINIPYGIKSIVSQTFQGCVNLKSVNLPTTLENIGYAAFRNCHNLEEIIIPEGVKVIEKRAFKDCVNLKRVKLPSTIERIEDEAFAGCPCEKSVKRFLKHKK